MHEQTTAIVLDYAPFCPRPAAKHPEDEQVVAVVTAVHALVVFVPASLGTVILGALLLIGQ